MQTRPATAPVKVDQLVKPGRTLSLDVFRGGTIAAMIMVNNQASDQAYPELLHARWHGWTFTDLVFPFFLWIIGVAITLSFAKRMERGDNRHTLLMHVIRRSALIFLVGLLLNGFPHYDLTSIRIPGVLQRIAVCYLAAATIFLYCGTRARVLWTAVLLGCYWLLMTLVPVPGCGAGSFERDCNFSKWIDGALLSGHMYVETRTWDPEGIVSTLPAIATVMFGIFAGQILAKRWSSDTKAAWLFFEGNVLIIAGWILSAWMPINKQLWTVPYSMFTAGLAFVVFTCCYWMVDVLGWRRFSKPFAIYGVNALALYVLSSVLGKLLNLILVSERGGNAVPLDTFIYRHVFEPLASPATASLAYSLTHVLLFLGIAWFMYRRDWIVRV